ncbi:MAG: 16S rRNA (guanine(966)-N(2))-methyltransferase RsmD [Chlorobiaceae bacterium]|nr:16S rRNA (guanine(966)-N(2))-methyltransferase RsmD [Chlorobiaceae bacterium]
MQILAGRYKGRKIRSSSSLAIRPCSSRVKKSLFDILTGRMDFDGASVLDLFAGFGSLGFEALSRGARSVCFVDQHIDALKALKATALQLGVTESVKIVNADVSAFSGRPATRQFGLVFCDPPYSWGDYDLLIERIIGGKFLAEEGVLLIEHSAHIDFSHTPYYSFHRDYGMTRVTFFQH